LNDCFKIFEGHARRLRRGGREREREENQHLNFK